MPEANVDELRLKASVAKSILDDVVNSSNHEDEKVGRILGSMAFLTAGAAFAFATFVGNRIGPVVYGVQLVSVLFLVYIFMLVLGTTLMLEAMSPRLHLWRGKGAMKEDDVGFSAGLDSMHFFKSIARRDLAEWLSYFENVKSADLLIKERGDALRQAHFLSTKVTTKVEYVRRGKLVIQISSIFIVVMVAVGVLSYL